MAYEYEPACRRMEWLDPFYKEVWEEAFAKAIPISGTFELTPRCNFQCRMCYVHLKEEEIAKQGKELTAKEWIRIAKEAKEAGTTWLCITGGEPFLHPEFEEIYKAVSRMGFFITLQTNASMIEQYRTLLEEYPPRSVKITLYGSNNEIYEAVCKVKNGFSRVDRGIQILKEMKIPVQLVSTIVRQNADDIKRMAFYAYVNQLPWLANGGIRLSVRGGDNKEIADSRIVLETDKERIRYLLEHDVVNPERKPCTYCKDYRLGYWITWDGKMRFCSFMNEPNISVREKGFPHAWQSLVQYEEQLEWPEECKSCNVQKACVKCAATLTSECGSPHHVKKEFCDRVKQYYDEEKGEWKL